MLQVVDVYDALCTARPYKPALAHDAAVRVMLEEADRGSWDRHIVREFVAMTGRESVAA